MCNTKTSNRTFHANTKEQAKKLKGDGFQNFAEKKSVVPESTPAIIKNNKGYTVYI